mmetsp:Transcript_4991/g.17335  ORF Transcript_4991/g.17335 Transcript_4991/m.17335 type:complete len:213 (+) Transcript_4991:411-1049(+)
MSRAHVTPIPRKRAAPSTVAVCTPVPASCSSIFFASMGHVMSTCENPPHAPHSASRASVGSNPCASAAFFAALYATSLIAFSGPTPTTCGPTPRQSAGTPPSVCTMRCIVSHTLNEPYSALRACRLVFTRSMGNTAMHPALPAATAAPKWSASRTNHSPPSSAAAAATQPLRPRQLVLRDELHRPTPTNRVLHVASICLSTIVGCAGGRHDH